MDTETPENEGKALLSVAIYWEGVYSDCTVETSDGDIINEDDSICTREGRVYHQDHIPDDHKNCEDIEEYSYSYDRVFCTRGNIEYWHHYRDAVYYNGDLYDSDALDYYNLYYCDDCGDIFQQNNSECLCENCDRNENEHDDYHDGCDENKAHGSTYKIGIEFEKCDCIENPWEYKNKGWRCETDSSCWYEYITPILPFDKVDSAFDWIVENGKDILPESINSDCGWHIHVSKEGVQPDELYKTIAGWRPLLWGLYPHRLSGYSSRNGDKYDHSVDVGVRNRTVEIRIFPWCDNKNTLRFRLEIVKFMLDNPAKNTADALKILGMKQLSFAKILDIVYGWNTERLVSLLDRMHKFYNEGITKPNNKILQIQKRIMRDKSRMSWQESDE